MKRITQILQEINSITLEIEEKYPELYQFLDENPITLSNDKAVDIEMFTDYRNTLKEQLEMYKASHKG
ncbi:MAG: hypothetical protein EP346_14335 [Bacteroidetes bacterium]|nr:MAG: hypothetical protein EP346_14335 [Bacteroidota bacterium]